MAEVNSNILTIIVNMNSLNTLIRRQRLSEWGKIAWLYAIYKKLQI